MPQHLHFAIIAAFAATVSACSSTYIVRCKDGDHLAIHESLYFGTAKPNGVVSSEDWAKFLETTVTPRFPKGLTSSRASGQWRGADGEIVREDSHVLQLLHPDDATAEKAIRELVETYKTQFKQVVAEMQTLFAGYDAMVTLCTYGPAPKISTDEPTHFFQRPNLTAVFNVTGNPAISICTGFDRTGLPLAMQIVGRPFDETTTLRIAHAYEQATPWRRLRPSLA